ncbi:hypothetical protein Tco_0317280 [Tanacetum coccineum]
MDAPTIPVSVDSFEGNFRDAPAAADAFPTVTIVAILASLGEAIRGIHEYLQGVPVEEDISTLRFRMSMIEAENASLRGKIRTMEAIETAMINQGVTAALAARDANRNGDDSHTSGGTGGRRTERIVQEYTYQDFMKCKPLYFKGTEGVVELTQWFKRMETVFRISNCSVEN